MLVPLSQPLRRIGRSCRASLCQGPTRKRPFSYVERQDRLVVRVEYVRVEYVRVEYVRVEYVVRKLTLVFGHFGGGQVRLWNPRVLLLASTERMQ